jgi:hypothetical protein
MRRSGRNTFLGTVSRTGGKSARFGPGTQVLRPVEHSFVLIALLLGSVLELDEAIAAVTGKQTLAFRQGTLGKRRKPR